jgi:hypothetical protein
MSSTPKLKSEQAQLSKAMMEYVSPAAVAAHFKVTRRTVYSWISGGYLPAVKIGPKLWGVTFLDISAFVRPGGVLGAVSPQPARGFVTLDPPAAARYENPSLSAQPVPLVQADTSAAQPVPPSETTRGITSRDETDQTSVAPGSVASSVTRNSVTLDLPTAARHEKRPVPAQPLQLGKSADDRVGRMASCAGRPGGTVEVVPVVSTVLQPVEVPDVAAQPVPSVRLAPAGPSSPKPVKKGRRQ